MSSETGIRAPTCFRRSIAGGRIARRGPTDARKSAVLRSIARPSPRIPALFGWFPAIGESTKPESGGPSAVHHGESDGIESLKARKAAGERSPIARMEPRFSMAAGPWRRVKTEAQGPGFRERFVLSAIEWAVPVYSGGTMDNLLA